MIEAIATIEKEIETLKKFSETKPKQQDPIELENRRETILLLEKTVTYLKTLIP